MAATQHREFLESPPLGICLPEKEVQHIQISARNALFSCRRMPSCAQRPEFRKFVFRFTFACQGSCCIWCLMHKPCRLLTAVSRKFLGGEQEWAEPMARIKVGPAHASLALELPIPQPHPTETKKTQKQGGSPTASDPKGHLRTHVGDSAIKSLPSRCFGETQRKPISLHCPVLDRVPPALLFRHDPT